MPTVHQLFHLLRDTHVVLVVTKMVDYLLATGQEEDVEQLVAQFDAKFKLGTVSHTPGYCPTTCSHSTGRGHEN